MSLVLFFEQLGEPLHQLVKATERLICAISSGEAAFPPASVATLPVSPHQSADRQAIPDPKTSRQRRDRNDPEMPLIFHQTRARQKNRNHRRSDTTRCLSARAGVKYSVSDVGQTDFSQSEKSAEHVRIMRDERGSPNGFRMRPNDLPFAVFFRREGCRSAEFCNNGGDVAYRLFPVVLSRLAALLLLARIAVEKPSSSGGLLLLMQGRQGPTLESPAHAATSKSSDHAKAKPPSDGPSLFPTKTRRCRRHDRLRQLAGPRRRPARTSERAAARLHRQRQRSDQSPVCCIETHWLAPKKRCVKNEQSGRSAPQPRTCSAWIWDKDEASVPSPTRWPSILTET